MRPPLASLNNLAVSIDRPTCSALDRRALVRSVLSVSLLSLPLGPSLSLPVWADEPMKTSSSFNSLQDLTGQISQNLGAGTISGKSRPETGCILLDEVQATGNPKEPTITAELVTNGGVVATVAFQAPWPIARGMYYDVEARSQEGDSAFVHVRSLPDGKSLMSVPSSYLTSSVFSSYGRFGAYGAATDVKVLSDVTKKDTRFLEVAFSVLSQGGAEGPRKAVIAAIQPEGSTDAVMLVSSASSLRWRKGAESQVRRAAESFRIVSARSSNIRRAASSDFRFEERGGLAKGARDTVLDELN
ncbi:hypothetical protein AB1Y20_017707 [Prymnesium parvum]|uniref:Uncharacterized protein n=1 Tax=Prymnesium parvum TaxID=97485 RepID=A0AB34JNX7_PRYPA